MTVFKAYLKVLNKNKAPIILYTIILICFGAFNFQTNDKSISFIANKPDVYIVNNDKEEGITENLVNYIKENSNLIELDEEKIDDALFYRDVNYIIYIPSNYRKDFLDGKKPKIEVKSTNDAEASFEKMLLERYLKVANTLQEIYQDETLIMKEINEALNTEVNILVDSKVDVTALSKVAFFYNFLSYSMLAGVIYVICLIISSFNNRNVKKRIIISRMNYQKHNRILLFSNLLFAFTLWLIYVIMSIVLCGSIIFTTSGIIYLINSLLFTIMSVTLALLISTIVNNKEAINGIVNVIALGSSFLCGAFVPVEYLPNFIIKIAHILPSYWFINTNNVVKYLEVFNLDALKPIIFNMVMLVLFSILFIILNSIISKKKQILS